MNRMNKAVAEHLVAESNGCEWQRGWGKGQDGTTARPIEGRPWLLPAVSAAPWLP